MSSYKDQTTRKTKEFQKKEQKGQNIKAIQSNKTKSSTNKQKIPIWNQHTYDVGTWTKDKIEMELLLNEISWSFIVSRISKKNSYSCTINLNKTYHVHHYPTTITYREERKRIK